MKFSNPYSELSRDETKVITVEVSDADYHLIKSIRPEQGTMSGVLGTLWSKLCYELRKRDIADYNDKQRFEAYVANLVFVDGDGRGLSNSTVGGIMPNATASDVGGRETPQGSGTPTTEVVVSDLPKRGRGKKRVQTEGEGQP